MRRLIDVINEKDIRYLLKEEVFDENELSEWIEPYMDVIFKEYEELKNDNFYQKHFEKQEFILYEKYKILALETLYKCINLKYLEGAEKINNEFKFKFDLKHPKIDDLIIQKMKSIIGFLQIAEIKEKEKRQEKIIWEDSIAYIHEVLGIQIDYDTTVKQYASYERAVKRKLKNGQKR